MKQLLLATPTFSAPEPRWRGCVDRTVAALKNYDVNGTVTDPRDSHIGRARNVISSRAVREGYGALFFVDADEIWPAQDAVACVLAVLDGDADIAAAPVALKRLDEDGTSPCNIDFEPGDMSDGVYVGPTWEIAKRPFGRFRRAGAGFMCISGKLLHDLSDAWPDLFYMNACAVGTGPGFALFDSMIIGKRWLPEDWSFCHRAQMYGATLRLLLDADVSHVGPFDYKTRIKRRT